MIIRAEQFAIFSEPLRKSFLQSVTAHLRRDFASDLARQGIADEQLERLVQKHADDAEQYGITAEEHLRLYLECIAILGPEFDKENSSMREILTREGSNAGEKMSEINEYLIFGLEEPR